MTAEGEAEPLTVIMYPGVEATAVYCLSKAGSTIDQYPSKRMKVEYALSFMTMMPGLDTPRSPLGWRWYHAYRGLVRAEIREHLDNSICPCL